MDNEAKLQKLVEISKTSLEGLLEHATFDSQASAICMNPGCDYTTKTEPDQDAGYCERCKTLTVKSCLILADVI